MHAAALPFRLVRATAFAAVCLGLGVAAHVLAGGALTGPVLGLGLAAGLAAAVPLSGRERGLGTILPLLTAVQVALHLLFSTAPAVVSGHAGHHAHGGLMPSLGMLVAHAWAAGLTAVWLARGEAVLWGLLRRMAARLIRLLAGPTAPAYAPPVVVRTARQRPLRSVISRHAISRRGPPRVVTTASH